MIADTPPFDIVGIGETWQHQLLGDELGQPRMYTHSFRHGGLTKAVDELNHAELL